MNTLPVVFGHCFSHDSKMSQREPRVFSTQFPCFHILANAQPINHCHKAKYKSGKCVFEWLCAWCKQWKRKMTKTLFALCHTVAPSKLEENGSFSCRDSCNVFIEEIYCSQDDITNYCFKIEDFCYLKYLSQHILSSYYMTLFALWAFCFIVFNLETTRLAIYI